MPVIKIKPTSPGRRRHPLAHDVALPREHQRRVFGEFGDRDREGPLVRPGGLLSGGAFCRGCRELPVQVVVGVRAHWDSVVASQSVGCARSGYRSSCA